jgi:transcriptional regulator with AAA-type ATPase domain/putative methionine-R-sulfoxide reductase with GAF domain
MPRSDDALDLLVPDADAQLLGRARNVTRFLRLLTDDAISARAASVGVDFDSARSELERHDAHRLMEAVTDLLRHHLHAIAGDDGFAWYGEPALGVQAAWRRLDEFREELPWIAGVPEPEERALGVARRLLETLRTLGVSEAESALWHARIVHWDEGARAAEALYRAELESERQRAATSEVALALLDGLVGCLLDRGAVREARNCLTERMSAAMGDVRLRHLLAWSRLALADFAGAKSVLVGLKPWPGVLPRALFELREHRPEWLPCLAGRAPCDEADRAGVDRRLVEHVFTEPAPPVRSRAEIGASVLCVFTFRAGIGADVALGDAAPALRPGLAAWLEERRDAWMLSHEREHRLIVTAQPVIAHRDGEAVLAGVLGRDVTRAVALAPVLDVDGEVAGWLHIECEHHLLPSRPRLMQMARAWAVELARESACSEGAGGLREQSDADPLSARGELCAEVLRQAMLTLGVKTAQRRWWGFALVEGDLLAVASGGEASALASASRGEHRALRRAVVTGGTVLFEEPDRRLSNHADAGSGLVLPLRAGGRVCGALAIESSRRRDFSARDVERFAGVVERSGLSLRLAQFREWHRQQFGFDVWFDGRRPDFGVFAESFLAAARSRAPVVLHGPVGSGKLVLARWLHFESRERVGPLRVFNCGSAAARGGLASLRSLSEDGSLLLEDVDQLDASLQEELLRWLDGHGSAVDPAPADIGPSPAEAFATRAERRPRVFATTRVGLADAMRRGVLRHDLALSLDRVQLRVPPLRERRDELIPLVQCLLRRFAHEERMPMPELTDEALAMLWRQDWDGNLRELENLAYKLVVLSRARGSRSRAVDVDAIVRVADHFGVSLVRKLNSRHPLRADVAAALHTTRLPGGRINKTRAAMFLGWDPDTLVARMQGLGLSEKTVQTASAWIPPQLTPAEGTEPAAEAIEREGATEDAPDSARQSTDAG